MRSISLEPQRIQQAEDLAQQPVDVLVVGGGIVGAGIARDAAMRGLRAAVVDRHDLAFGTSSRSSRLLHGGLRYLAQGRIGLVREASREKMVLARIAPHLARPLPFLFPTYRRTSWPLWQLRIGVKVYDMLCGRNFDRSSSMRPRRLVELLPGIRQEGLTGAVCYFDGLTNDARLVLDTLRSAARHEAVVLNYTEFEGATRGVTAWSCQLRDMVTRHSYKVLARAVVNATGPWAGTLPGSGVRLRLTKGVHLVVDRQRLPLPETKGTGSEPVDRGPAGRASGEAPVPLVSEAVVMTDRRRILFAIPWGQRVILGTTDTDYEGPLDVIRTEPAEIDYILSIVNGVFPTARLTPADVISHWAGLRPLLASGHGEPSDISRAHEIRMPHPGWLDVAGGKLTTYRLIAQQAVDYLLPIVGRAERCRTAEEPLLEPAEVEGTSGIEPPEVCREVVEHYCRKEWAVHLDDVMIRRSSWHYYHPNALEIAHRAAAWMAAVFGWDEHRQDEEIARYRAVTRE